MKSKQSESWEWWIEGPEGKKCLEGTTSGKYLQNRLWAAFMAGYNARKSE